VILEGPNDILIEQSLKFELKASNNQAEYEALIAGMTLAQEMRAENLRAKSDSQLVISQITGEYQTKDAQLIKYLAKLQDLARRFIFFEAVYVPREQHSRADLLAKLASTKRLGNNRTVIQEVVTMPNTSIETVHHVAEGKEGWMDPLLRYLTGSFTPDSN
jgi:ribonuclease HI